MRWVKFIVGCVAVMGLAVGAALKLGDWRIHQLTVEVDKLQREREELRGFVERLGASRRVAQVEVLRQKTDADGKLISTLLFQETGADGALGLPVQVEVIGRQAYFEALVMKFDQELVAKGDPERGASLAMFRRIFGDGQAAQSARDLDRALGPPSSSSQPADVTARALWARFWEMVDDPSLASRYGVRVAQIEAPAIPLRLGNIWQISLESAGGLDIRRIGQRDATEKSSLPEG